jgi:hypothetical protein
MKFARRLLAVIVMLLASVGIVCCIAGSVGIWVFRQKATPKVESASAQLDAGLKRATTATENVQNALARARASLVEVKKNSADLGGDEKGRRASGLVRMLIQREVAPSVDNLGGRLATFSDVAVAVAAMLDGFQDLPESQTGKLSPDKLNRWADQATQLSTKLNQLQTIVGDGDTAAAEKDVLAATSEVDLVLQRCQATVDEWQSDLDRAGAEVTRVKSQILDWLAIAVIAVPIVGAWLALSQVSLFAHAWKWCRRA